MSSKKLAVLAVLALALPAVLVIAPTAAAQEELSFARGVRWVPQPNHEQRLYIDFGDSLGANGETTQPPCAVDSSGNPTGTPATGGNYNLSLVPRPATGDTHRRPCSFVSATTAAGSAVGGPVAFRSEPLRHNFTVTGNRSLIFFFRGELPGNSEVKLQLQSGQSVTLDARRAPTSGNTSSFSIEFGLGDAGRYEFKAGERISLTMTVTAQSGFVPVGGVSPWTLSDANGGSYLEVRGEDALKVATWTQTETGNVTSVFRPLPPELNNTTSPPLIVGYFAIQSAFGEDDALGVTNGAPQGLRPNFTVVKDNRPIRLGPQQLNVLQGEYVPALSSAGTGRAVYRFPANFMDYRGFQNGEYSLLVDMDYHQGSAYKYGVDHKFHISDQGVRLLAYEGEQLAHDVLSGSTTTYLFLVRNTGSSKDTFRLDATLASAQPPLGWGARIGGPNVRERSIDLAPGEQKLVTLTVTAPFGAAGDSSTFVLTARSTLDTTVTSQPLSVVTRIQNNPTRLVDVIPPTRELAVVGGTPEEFSVYLWNRGTLPGNLSLALALELQDGWEVQLVQGTIPTPAVTTVVAPGDIAEATIRVVGPLNRQASTQEVTLNVTHRDVNGVSVEKSIEFFTRSVSAVRIDILDSFNGVRHVAETNWAGPSGGVLPVDGGNDDGLDGTWTRLWITNTGVVDDDFDLEVVKQRDDCSSTVFQDGAGRFDIYFRDRFGTPIGEPVRTVNLRAGQTAELYVWRNITRANPLDTTATPGPAGPNCSPDEFKFVVRAVGQRNRAEATVPGSVTAINPGSTDTGVNFHIEGADRVPNYARESPYVKIDNVTRTTLVQSVRPEQNATFRLRLTNAAHFGYFETTDNNGAVHKHNTTVGVRIAGVDPTSGWKMLLRPATGQGEDVNPFREAYFLDNNFSNRREGWVDQEIEVRVVPPNGTLAGTSFQALVQAFRPGTDDTKTMILRTRVDDFADIVLDAEDTRVSAHPGEPGVFLLKIVNRGSAVAKINLNAALDPQATTGGTLGWSVVLSENRFEVPAFRSRTVAVLVTPPPTASEGATAELAVNLTYPENPTDAASPVAQRTLRLTTAVVPADSLSLTASQTTVTQLQERPATFTLSLASSRMPLHYKVNVTSIPGWPEAAVLPAESNLTTGPHTISVVFNVPREAVNGTSYSSVVRVFEDGNEERNFDSIPLTITIRGGQPIASIVAPTLQKTVDRGQNQTFEILVSNLGNAAGRVRLDVRTADAAWAASFHGVNDSANPYVDLAPNQLKSVNVTVRAPLNVPENTVVPVDVTASPEGTSQSVTATIQARVHDYALDLTISPPSVDLVAGTSTDVLLKVRNRGNDNDTLNLTYLGLDLPEWEVRVSVERVTLEAGAEREVRATIKSPTGQLPSPRAYTFKFFSASLGGSVVNISKNDTVTTTVTVLRYQPLDVDKDDRLELAVDLDKNEANGFEAFREVFSEGLQTAVVEPSTLHGKTRFLLDVPTERLDGVADVWFDPEAVYAHDIAPTRAFDVTKDRTPDYLVDTDRDGKVDRTYDTDTDRYLETRELRALGDSRTQFLVDSNGDGRLDRYYDPDGKFATDAQRLKDRPDVLGLDTDNDGKVDKHYDLQSGTVTAASVAQATSFLLNYWWFVLAFLAMVVLTVVLVVRRRRG